MRVHPHGLATEHDRRGRRFLDQRRPREARPGGQKRARIDRRPDDTIAATAAARDTPGAAASRDPAGNIVMEV